MTPSSNLIIIYTCTVIAGTLLILTSIIGVLLIIHLSNRTKTESKKQSESHYRYFNITATLSAICNICCCAAVLVYTIWLSIEPDVTHSVNWYIMMRALPTSFWFASKASLICMYNGRLYFTFQKGRFISSQRLFIFITILITTSPFLFTTCGYLGVWYQEQWMISLGFEGFRFLYILLTVYLLFMFSRKMMLINGYERNHMYSTVPTREVESNTNESKEWDAEIAETTTSSYDVRASQHSEEEHEELLWFLNVTTKYAVLALIITIFECLVAICWIVFTWALQWNAVNLLLPLIMFCIDSVVDSICIYLFFGFAKTLYSKYCSALDACFRIIVFAAGKSATPKKTTETLRTRK